MIVAAVPVKDLENAKQRLVRLLTPGERRELARAMLGDVLRALADAAVDTRAAVFAPSRSGLGTNGVALQPPDVMRLRFGEPSFDDHLAAARALRVRTTVVPLPGLGLDIDEAADLAALLETGTATDSARLVAGWDVARRVPVARAVGD